jgi:hypothetical protein
MPDIAQRQPAPTPVTDTVPLPREVPDLPEDVFERFPSLRDWQEQEDAWWNRAYNALQEQNRTVAQTVSSTQQNARTLRISFNEFRAEVTEEIDAIVDATGAMAKRIVTVSAMAGVNSNIKVQTTAPGTPSVGDYWLDTSDLSLVITYKWDGLSWVEVTEPIAFAGVADERTARVTADGFLEGKYTLTVAAGTVITGFNITSASGPGTNVSNVAWTADQFQIYSGTTNKTMFVADAIQDKVRIASVLTVDGANTSVYIKTTAGVGSYNSAGTPWFVDNLGRMSLGTGLTFDGSNLTISGTISATAGSIGGWTISSTTLSRNNAILDSAGQLVLGTSNDVVYLSATDATYRIWIGNVTAGSASFAVSKTGAMFSNAGTIGGWTIGSTTLTGTNIALSSVASVSSGVSVGSSGAARTYLFYNAGTPIFAQTNSAGIVIAQLFPSSSHGRFELYDSLNNLKVQLIADNGAAQLTFSSTSGLSVSGGSVTATTFSGSGASLTSLNASNISSGTLANARLPSAISVTSLAGDGSGITGINASNISSGTLSNSRLPSAISVISLATANFQANVGSAVDFISVNLRGFNGGTQTFRIDYTTGELYIQNVRILSTRQPTPVTLGDVIAAGQAHGLWS